MEFIGFTFQRNLMLVATPYVLPNILFGLFVVIISHLFLSKDARREDSYFTYNMTDSIKMTVCVLLMVLLAVVPFPLREEVGMATVLQVVSMAVCFTVCTITSVTDEKSGLFKLGYLIMGLLAEAIMFLIMVMSGHMVLVWGVVKAVVFCLPIIAVFGLFCCSAADAGLFIMGLITFMVCVDASFWGEAVVIMMMGAAVTYVIRYSMRMIVYRIRRLFFTDVKQRVVGREAVGRFPFTVHIFIGIVMAFFLR